MSVINRMLKDLEQRQQTGHEAAVYVAPARPQGWWMATLTLLCALALAILGWRTWIYWQQSQRPAPGEPAVVVAAPPVSAPVVPEPASATGPVSQQAAPASPVSAAVTESVPAVVAEVPAAAPDEAFAMADEIADAADEAGFDEIGPSDAALQPDLQAELAAEQQAAIAPPRPAGVLKIETVELSEPELAALAERKATTAMAKGKLREAQDDYYEVLSHDPHNQGAREQLAGLLYGEGRLIEAGKLLEEGLRLDPDQADFRLLLARLAISGGERQKALGWLSGQQPDLASNLDYYTTWAGLAQELGLNAQAADLYIRLLRQQPDQGRWWLGLGVAEDGQGHSQRALDAYRNAKLHGNLGAASTQWLEQRIAQLAP